MKLVRDNLHGFSERPHYQPIELENMFEKIVTDFLKKKYGKVEFPFRTDDITTLSRSSQLVSGFTSAFLPVSAFGAAIGSLANP